MPYQKTSELPKGVLVLPEHGRRIWMKTFNAVLKRFPGDEERAAKIAWSAASRVYVKKGDKWVRRARHGTRGAGTPTPAAQTTVEGAYFPWENFEDLPDDVRELPSHAREVWIVAYRRGLSDYGGDREEAIKVAWEAVGKIDTELGKRWKRMTVTRRPGGLVLTEISDRDFAAANRVFGAVPEEHKGELLKFTNAILCRAEVNRNQDELSPDNVREIAATLDLLPIDWRHEETKTMGFFVNARVQEGHRCLTDGIVWARRHPEAAQGIRDGSLRLSVEATAELAICSYCGEQFERDDDYCEHLQGRVNTKQAVRRFVNMRAKGGGLTPTPAGRGTLIPRNGILMLAEQDTEGGEKEMTNVTADEVTVEAQRWWKKYWSTEGEIPDAKFLWLSDAYRKASPKKREDMNKSEHRKLPVYNPQGGVDEGAWRAAWAIVHGARGGIDTAGGPSVEKLTAKLKRIKPKGIEISEEEGGVTNMSDEETVETPMVKCPECGAEFEADEIIAAALVEAEVEAEDDEGDVADDDEETIPTTEAEDDEEDDEPLFPVGDDGDEEEVSPSAEELTKVKQQLGTALKAKAKAERTARIVRTGAARAVRLAPIIGWQEASKQIETLGELSREAYRLVKAAAIYGSKSRRGGEVRTTASEVKPPFPSGGTFESGRRDSGPTWKGAFGKVEGPYELDR